MGLPADNKLVDENGRIVPAWRKVFEKLSPLLDISTPDNAESISTLIAALGAGEGISSGSIGSILYHGPNSILALPLGVFGSSLTPNLAGDAPEWSGGNSWITPIDEKDVSGGDSTVEFTEIDSSYSNLVFYFDRVSSSTGNNLQAEFDTSSGFGTAINCAGAKCQFTSGAATISVTSGATANIGHCNAAATISGLCILLNYSKTDRFKTLICFFGAQASNMVAHLAIYTVESADIVDNVRFGFLTGVIDAGKIFLGGIR